MDHAPITLPRPTPGQALLGAAFLAALFVLPLAGELLLARFGVRAVAAVVLVVAARGLAGAGSGSLAASLPRYGAPLALLGAAWWTGERLWLALLPALVNVVLAVLFARTLLEEQSLVERVARSIHPYLPAFTRRYCHVTTAVWVAFFLASAGVIAWMAIFEPQRWRFFATTAYLAVLVALSAAEFLFRKLWFRYYGSGPLDRVLARLFPAQATARGRRSVAHIERMQELGW